MQVLNLPGCREDKPDNMTQVLPKDLETNRQLQRTLHCFCWFKNLYLVLLIAQMLRTWFMILVWAVLRGRHEGWSALSFFLSFLPDALCGI